MEKVVMPQNGIYHEGIRALAEALSENPALQHLDLNDNLLTPKGGVAFSGRWEGRGNRGGGAGRGNAVVKCVCVSVCIVRSAKVSSEGIAFISQPCCPLPYHHCFSRQVRGRWRSRCPR